MKRRRAANSYAEACAIMRLVQYGERAHRKAIRLTQQATLRNDSQWLRDQVRDADEVVKWVSGGIPARLVEGEQ